MDHEAIRRHINQQLLNIMDADMDVEDYLEPALVCTNRCLDSSSGKYHTRCSGVVNPYHSIQYMILLYWISRIMFQKDKGGTNVEKVYYLNKTLNCVDLFYEICLPSVWCAEHPLGSVMGRAQYGDRFFFYQGCTVGGNYESYPVLGSNVIMYSNSKILGNSIIGNNVILSANSYVINRNIPDNSIVFGQGRDIKIKQISSEVFFSKTKNIWKYAET